MIFNSWEFIIFLPLCASLYFFLLKIDVSNRIQNYFLVASSLFFYSYGQVKYLPFLLASSFIDFFLGKRLSCLPNKSKKRKLYLALSVLFNIGILFILKYGNWIYSQYSSLLCISRECDKIISLPDFILPVGISFYTFQTLSYTFDVYRDNSRVEKNLITYLSYVTFFPQLVAGPIERSSDLIPQFKHKRILPKKEDLSDASMYIFWGLFKKIVFADNLGNLVNIAGIALPPGSGFIVAFAFSFQIYCDFSAYSDLARGVARIFGIKIRRNFLVPYSSRTPSEFWQRWHISLSDWIRDYIYIPLGGNKKGRLRTFFNLLITMILAGMWHGSGEMFLLWGIYHGAVLIIYRIIPISDILDKLFPRIGKYLSVLIMYGFICFGWLIFISKDLENLIHWGYNSLNLFLNPISNELLHQTYGLVLFTVPIIITEIIARKYNSEFTDILLNLKGFYRGLLLIIIFYAMIIFGKREAYDFIYFQF